MRPVSRWQRAFESRGVQVVLVGAAVLGVLIGPPRRSSSTSTLDPLADVRAYYHAGARLNAGLPLYVQPAGTDDAAFYRYPPLLAVAFRPLPLLPFETAALIWEARPASQRSRRRWCDRASSEPSGPGWSLCWLAAPIAWSLAVGQAQVLVTFLVILGTPWGIALAANLKLLPILVAVYWIGRRDRRSLLTLAAWLVGLAALSFVLEPAGTVAFLGFPDLAQVGDVENLLALCDRACPVARVRRTTRRPWRSVFSRRRPGGWALAVAVSVLMNPRLLMYQLSTLQAAVRPPDFRPTRPVSSRLAEGGPAGPDEHGEPDDGDFQPPTGVRVGGGEDDGEQGELAPDQQQGGEHEDRA